MLSGRYFLRHSFSRSVLLAPAADFMSLPRLYMVLMAIIMDEATFFSPCGVGGVIWAISVVRGYCIDM